MAIPQPIIEALKKVPFLRESYYVARIGGRAARNTLHGLTGKTHAAKNLEKLFQGKPDPWDFESAPWELERFEKIWSIVPPQSFGRILEIGCAEGHFTEQIAGRFPSADILAIDFVPLALERARQRCAKHPCVRFEQVDIGKQGVNGAFDLIFCMGVLEHGPRLSEVDRIRDWVVAALAPGGFLVLETWRLPAEFERRWWARKFAAGARAVHDRFLAPRGMELARETLCCDNLRLASLLHKKHE
jgi:2-polyprenyl-3-methyl-5-hydroxy-6-metoxy-1,4-benzoquinol methylase